MCSHQFLQFVAFMVLLLPKLVENKKCSDFKTNATTLGPPIMTELKENKTIYHVRYVGNFLTLQCCTYGNPSPTVVWFKNKRKIDLNKSKFVPLLKNQSLWMKSLRVEDSGLYSCASSNMFGNVSRYFDVHIKSALELQKPVVIFKPSSQSVVVHSNVSLTCIIDKIGSNKPFIRWHFNKTSTRPLALAKSKRHFKSLTKLDQDQKWITELTIINVSMADNGTYFCVASNGRKSNNDKGVLIVQDLKEIQSKLPALGDPSSPWQQKKSVILISTTLLAFFVIAVTCGMLWYKRKNAHNRSTDNPIPLLENDENDFDVFISYSSQDRKFVKETLFNKLSTTHRVCIDYKDFEAGLYIGDNIRNSIFRSRKTLLVVSKNFLRGVWTHFEMQIAQGRLVKGQDVLIPVIIEEISFDDLPDPLKHYHETKTYLEYFNDDVRPHFWNRLRSALGPPLPNSVDTVDTTQV